MSQETTLVLIKPDGVLRGLIGTIISRFEQCGLKVIGMKMVYPNEELASEHYIADEEWMKSIGEKTKASYEKRGEEMPRTVLEQGQWVRESLMKYLVMSPIVALAIKGHNAVKHVRKIVGATAPSDAAPGTIRGDFSFDTYRLSDTSNRPVQNLIHASGEVDEAQREVKVWFTEKELHDWERVDEALLYRTIKE